MPTSPPSTQSRWAGCHLGCILVFGAEDSARTLKIARITAALAKRHPHTTVSFVNLAWDRPAYDPHCPVRQLTRQLHKQQEALRMRLGQAKPLTRRQLIAHAYKIAEELARLRRMPLRDRTDPSTTY